MRGKCIAKSKLTERVKQDRKSLRTGTGSLGTKPGIWVKNKKRPENSWELNRVRRLLAENDEASFRNSWNDGMQKLEINWKKVGMVQAEATAKKQERNREDKEKKQQPEREKNLVKLPVLNRIALGEKHKTIQEQFGKRKT